MFLESGSQKYLADYLCENSFHVNNHSVPLGGIFPASRTPQIIQREVPWVLVSHFMVKHEVKRIIPMSQSSSV